MAEQLDKTTSLFEHIRNRLPTGFGFGDDGAELVNGVYNHKTFQQTLREDHEGDVGIFEIYSTELPKYTGYTCLVAEVQIAVVCKQGDIEGARKYLQKALENIRDNEMSEYIWIKSCKLVNLKPLGKNSNGLNMMVLNINIKYLVNE